LNIISAKKLFLVIFIFAADLIYIGLTARNFT